MAPKRRRRGPEPPQETDEGEWTRRLAAARGADLIQTRGAREIAAYPLTKKRLAALLPVAQALYDEHALPIAQAEWQRIETILEHCQPFLVAMGRLHRELGIDYSQRAKEPWDKELCETEAAKPLVKFTLKTLRPAPVDAIGHLLIPRSSAWRLFRNARYWKLSETDKSLRDFYSYQMNHQISVGELKQDDVQPLQNLSFVSAVLARAPPLVRALPPQWSAAERTDNLHEALQALLRIRRTRSLSDLVDLLSDVEVEALVTERSCLSQLLNGDTWALDCAQGRNLDEYLEFALFLWYDTRFNGLLQPVPPRAQQADESSQLVDAATTTGASLQVGDSAVMPGKTEGKSGSDDSQPTFAVVPPQTDTAAWIRMLAAARGADMIQSCNPRELAAHPLTMARVDTLLPIARDLYDERVRRMASTESRRLETILVHCQPFLGAMGRLYWKLRIAYKQRVKDPWDKKRCQREAARPLVPFTLKTLRPAPPDAIGLCLIPQESAWCLLCDEMNHNMSRVAKRLKQYYSVQLNNAVNYKRIDQSTVQPLHNVQFADAVLVRSPPLVRALPQTWTSPDKTDELLNALQALLKMPYRRALTGLNRKMSKAEHSTLVTEHSCLSQIFEKGYWAPDCDEGRNVDEYVTFARYLLEDKRFKGLLHAVPPKGQTRQASRRTGVLPNRSADFNNGADGPDWLDSVRQVIASFSARWPDTALSASDLLPAPKRQRIAEHVRAPEALEPLDLGLGIYGDEELVQQLGLREWIGPAANSRADWLWTRLSLPSEHGSTFGVPTRPPSPTMEQVGENASYLGDMTDALSSQDAAVIAQQERSVSRAGAILARSHSAAALSGVSVAPLAALGLLLFLVAVAVAFRRRARRVADDRSLTRAVPVH